MKRLLVIPILLMLILSCKKDKKKLQEPEGKLYAIGLEANGFSMMTEDMPTVRAGAKILATTVSEPGALINHLYLRIYRNKILVKDIHQVRGSGNFGKVIDSLSAGRYEMVFLASIDTIEINKEKNWLVLSTPGTDIFHKEFELDVSGPINKTVTLERVVSLIQVKLEDLVPFSVKKIEFYPLVNEDRYIEQLPYLMTLFNRSVASDSESLQEGLLPYTKTITEAEYNTNLTVNIYVLGFMNSPTSVGKLRMRTFDSTGDVLNTATVKGIPIVSGQRTTLKGTLFDKGISGTGFVITVPNTTWPDRVVEF